MMRRSQLDINWGFLDDIGMVSEIERTLKILLLESSGEGAVCVEE